MLKFNAPFSGTQVGKEAEGEPQQAGNKFETKLNGHLSTALLGNENRSVCKVSFLDLCSKMQIIPIKNLNIKKVVPQFLWFFRLKC